VKAYPKDTFKVTVGSTDTINDLLEKVLDALKLTSNGTKSAKIRRIIERLQRMRNEGMHPVIVFDEAEYMKQATLCNIKELHDALNKVCGIVLIGTHQIVTKLTKLRNKDREGIPQFYRRIKFGTKHLNGIDTRFKDFLNGLSDKGLVSFLQQNCDNYGELHDVLVPAMREARRTGEPLTENFVRMVLGMPKN
jgi:DNA transposition AAA+ family ATPase